MPVVEFATGRFADPGSLISGQKRVNCARSVTNVAGSQGMPVLAAMVEDDFADGGAMTRAGLACTWRLLELHGPAALNSLCRLLAAAGLAPRLVAALGAAAVALAAVSLPVRCRAPWPRVPACCPFPSLGWAVYMIGCPSSLPGNLCCVRAVRAGRGRQGTRNGPRRRGRVRGGGGRRRVPARGARDV